MVIIDIKDILSSDVLMTGTASAGHPAIHRNICLLNIIVRILNRAR
jgi:hypothetical protein